MSLASPPSATLFGELRSRLSKDAWSAVKVDTLERTVLDMYSCIELFAKMHPHTQTETTGSYQKMQNHKDNDVEASEIAFCEAMWNYFVDSASCTDDQNYMIACFLKSLDHYAALSNDIRFYIDLLSPQEGDCHRKCQILISVRKAISHQKMELKYPGLISDKVFFNWQEWSQVAERALSHLDDYGGVLQQLQRSLEPACKSHLGLKSGRENLNRLSMTTLVESLVDHLYKAEHQFQEGGKHPVEERLHRLGRGSPAEKTEVGKGRTGEGREAGVKNDAKVSVNSPLKLLGTLAENEDRKFQNSNPYKDEKRIESKAEQLKCTPPTKKGLIHAGNPEELDYSVLEAMRGKKEKLGEELKLLQGTKAEQTNQVIKALAELSILNKEMKSLNTQYFEVSKKFEGFFKNSLQKQGKNSLPKHTIETFNEICKYRKATDYVAELNGKLGSPFLKFTTKNLMGIKSQEVKFYEKIKRLKQKSSKIYKKDEQQSLESEDFEEEPNLEHHQQQDNKKDFNKIVSSQIWEILPSQLAGDSSTVNQQFSKPFESPVFNSQFDHLSGSRTTQQPNHPAKRLDLDKEIEQDPEPLGSVSETKQIIGNKDHNKVDIENIQIARTQYSEDEDE